MVALSLDGLTKRFGTTAALEDVDLSVRDGEFFTLVGPSGCGKTTTLRTVAGFESPDAGSVRFGDREMLGVPPEERNVGIVFQSYALFPHMTVAENVAYGLRFRDPPGEVSRDERVAELLDLVDLSGFEDRDPEALSGGQQQRVALARALAPGPDVLLLDEPMSALDARLREELRRTVKAIQTDLGITTVYVTHDQEEALAVSDRVAVMHDGGVEQVGTPREVYRTPATEFVARFVGENNVFTGRVTGVADGGSAQSARSRTDAGGATAREMTVDVDGHSFAVATDADLSSGDEVTFCVRPANLVADHDENRLDVEVGYREFMGEVVRVHCDWGGRTLVLRSPDPPERDDLTVGFDPADAYVVAPGDE